MKPETQEWIDTAEIDLSAAQALLEREILPPVVFHSHLAVEKMLKAHWVEQHEEGFPPRTHDLIELIGQLDFDLPGWHEYLVDLTRQAVASRYAGKDDYSRQEAVEYLGKARELCGLLRQKLR